MSEPDSPAGKSLRISMEDLEIDLPIAWARRHDTAVVAFRDGGRGMGWHVRLLGDDGQRLLAFPWYDHVDCALGGLRRYWFAPWRVLFAGRPPTVLSDDGWDDVEEGWWASVVPEGADVYIAETFDEIGDIAPPLQVTCAQPGNVFVNGVPIAWNCVSRNTYDDAWQAAIKSCRQGRPHPVVRGWER